MMQLPHEMRDAMVEHLDEYLEVQSGSPDGEAVAAYVVELIGTVAEELKLEDTDELVLKLETSGEMDATLLELLEEEFESNDEFEYTGEEIVSLVEKVCEIDWTTKDDEDEDEDDEKDDKEDDDDPDGFFDDPGAEDEDDL